MTMSLRRACALAVCVSTAPPALAQLTLYGIADASIVRLQAGSRGGQWQIRDGGMNASRIGFTGNEDLGGGWRAGFNIESQINLNTGTGTATNTTNQPRGQTTTGGFAWNRRSTLSLHSPYGEVRLGRDYVTTFIPVYLFDPFATVGVASATNFQSWYTPSLAPMTLSRASNIVAYHLPPTVLKGLYAYAQAAPSEGSGARYAGLGAGYREGPLQFSLAVAEAKNPLGGSAGLSPATTAADNRLSVWSAGAGWEVAKGLRLTGVVHAQHFDRFGTTVANTEVNRRVHDWLLGVTWAFGVHTLKYSHVRRDDRGATDFDPSQDGAGYVHNLSKRTAIYLTYVHIRNGRGGTYNFSSSNFAPPAGESARALQLGMNHIF